MVHKPAGDGTGEDRATRLLRQFDKMFNNTERSNQRATWDLLSEFMLPNQSGIFQGEDTPGGKKTRRVYDSTAIQAARDLGSAMHATLTNPATKWAKLRYSEEDLNNDDEAVAWLEEATNMIMRNLNESNFDTQAAKNYNALPVLGTIALFQEEENEKGAFDGFRFTAYHLSQVCFSENSKGQVDKVGRKFRLTARQAHERWGDKLGRTIMDALNNDPEKEFEFTHLIMPREKDKVELDSRGLAIPEKRPFASIYIENKEKEIVEEGGYYEFPVYVARWQTMPGEIYGRGPGHIALPDVRTLNMVKQLGLKAINKSIDPPIIATQRGILGSLDLRPGRLNVVRDINGLKEMVPQTRFDVTQFAVEDLRTAIKSIFFIDKLMLPPRDETGEMTAFEVSKRLEHMQRILGPVVSRLNVEFLTPLLVRSFKMMLRAGVLPEIPATVLERGLNLEIDFINQLARSQQLEDVNNIQAWVQELAMIAQLKPEIVDYVNADGIARHTAKVRGIPEIAVTNQKTVEQVRTQRAQQQAAAQTLDAGVQAADIASKLGGSGGLNQ